jgi:hypothetical protein
VTIPSEIDTTALATITPVGTTLGDIFLSAKMRGASPSLSRPDINLYIIYEV